MNTFAGTIVFKRKIDLSEVKHTYLIMPGEATTIFICGETKIDNSDNLIEYFENYGEMLDYDISLSTEDNMVVMNLDFEKQGVYEGVAFEGPDVDMKDISSRFLDSFEAVCVREAEESEKFGNRIVKVDFVY